MLYIWYITIKKYLRLKFCIIMWIMGKFYKITLENFIRFKYGKQMINYCIKGSTILDQTLGQNSVRLSHSRYRILSPSMRENISSIFSLMHIYSYIWKGPEKKGFPWWISATTEKEIEHLSKIVNENPSPRVYKKSAPSLSLSCKAYFCFIVYEQFRTSPHHPWYL